MDTDYRIAASAARPRHQALIALLPPLAFMAVSLAGLRSGYLLFHTLAELFPILIAFTALVVATTSFTFTRNHFLVYIAVATGWCATLDVAHVLVYRGMHLINFGDGDTPIRFWIAARLIQAVAMATSPLLLRHRMPLPVMHLIYSTLVLAAGAIIVFGNFPPLLVEGHGLTPIKIGIEYLIIALLGLAFVQLWRQRRQLSRQICLGILTALAMMMASEFTFTLYADLYAPSNLVGHLLKISAYWFIYQALVTSTLREPFAALARAARTYDAVPDPTLIVSPRGLIRSANAAAGRRLGVDPAVLIGQSRHALFHDPSVPEAECPVCGRLHRDGEEFQVDLTLDGGARTLECSVAPFGDNHRTRVEVLHDISERKGLYRDRERLIGDLNERIRELRGLRAISALSGKRELLLEDYLRGVAALLPDAFRENETRARAAIVCAWGRFGDALPVVSPACQIEHPVSVDGAPRGMLKVWRPAGTGDRIDDFLPEESALLEQVAQTVGETIERLRDAGRVRQLSGLYEMLTTTNRALVYSRSTDELLANIFDGLIAGGDFSAIFLALCTEGGLPLQLVHTHGIPRERLADLNSWLTDAHGAFALALPAFASGNVMSGPVPPPVNGNAPWRAWLHEEQLTEHAIIPLMREDNLLGVIGLFAPRGLATFDDEQLRLLNEMAVDIAFGLNTLLVDDRRRLAEAQATTADRRFRDIFEASPLPMLIVALDTRQVIGLNRAHRQWLGYEPEDIPDEAACFRLFFNRDEEREAMRRLWNASIAEGGPGKIVGPEVDVSVRRKDGRERLARGTLTLSDNTIILAWTDITRIRESERRLSESERRFRRMIEQTNSGIYVRRDARFLYVNPRYCEMIGWSPEELLGHDVLEITLPDPANLTAIREAWGRLHEDGGVVAYEVPIRRKDGAMVQLGLTAKVILWDDDLPATIVMAQDITEKKRTEAQLADYVNRLEGSLKATLQAVSTMVELRDPYTAGHERRVGLIAGDIGRALGWPPKRCEMLEMTGLVHDIGKIAVPSEILTKPTRLTPLEMEIIKGHAEAGYEILKDVPFEAPVAETIRQHHERLDGSGYPRGLKGDEILPEARVLAVADVVESMAAHRPYRAALGMDKAVAELERGRGSHYDPAVVDALLTLVREKAYKLPQ